MTIETYIEGNKVVSKSKKIAASDRVMTVFLDRHGQEFCTQDPDVSLICNARESSTFIEYEQNATALQSLRQYKAERLDIVKARNIVLRSVDLRAYSSLVRLHTTGYHIIHKWTGEYEVVTLRDAIRRGYGHWTTRHLTVEMITPLEALLRKKKALGIGAPKRVRDSIEESIRHERQYKLDLEAHNIEYKKSIEWRSDPVRIFVRASPVGIEWFPGVANPNDTELNKPVARRRIFRLLKVPIRRWDLIRQEWIRRLREVIPECERLNAHLAAVNRRIRALERDLRSEANRLVQICATEAVSTVPNSNSYFNGGVVKHLSWHGNQYSFWLPLATAVENPDEEFYIAWDCFGMDIESPAKFRNFVESLRGSTLDLTKWARVGTLQRGGWLYQSASTGYSYSAPDWAQPPHKITYLAESVLYGVDIANGERVDHADPRLVPECSAINADRPDTFDPELWDNAMASATLGLLNGDLRGKDSIEFNYSRSIGEQKDTPKTLTTASAFLAFLLARGEEPPTWWEIWYKGMQEPYRSMKPDWARWTTNPELARKGKKFHDPRILKIVKCTATGSTPLRTLVDAYLGYQYGVKPTVQDIATTMKQSRDWLTATRRSLMKLGLSILDGPNYRVTKRYTRLADFRRSATKHGKLLVNDPAEYSISEDYSDEVDFQPWINDLLSGNLSALPHFTWIGLDEKERTIPVLRSRRGLVFPLAPDLVPVQPAERLLLERALTKHNLSVINPMLWPSRLYYRRDVRGCAFGRYSLRAWKRLTDPSSWLNKLASLRMTKTAWELAPLSFIWEWFTNAAEISSALDNLVNYRITGVEPVGGAWHHATERYLYALDDHPAPYQVSWVIDEMPCWALLTKPHSTPVTGYLHGSIRCVPKKVKWHWELRNDHGERITTYATGQREYRTTSVAFTNRRPAEDAYALPELRWRVNLNLSKFISLLAIFGSWGSRGKVLRRNF
jgi:hypothetical protein